MAIEPDVQSLVQEILESGRSVDDVCRDCMHLLPQVRRALHKVMAVAAEVDAMFATRGAEGTATTAPLPCIPGYEVKAILGHGGMGVVYHAHHLKLERPVAIKMLLSGVYASPAEIERFRREAVAVARLHHPNIVQVHDVGDFEGRPFFTMELLGGGSLAARLGGAPQPAADAATLLAMLSEAVHAAHGSGVIHRDLKPANVLLATDGTPKIADFGLARTIGSEPGLTLTGARLGTPSYMAPEQALGRKDAIGPAVDVYALGAMLYEVLTGRPPFRGESAAETERQVITMTPAPPSRLNASVPRDLETICLKCLNKDPPRRYATAADLAEDLGRFLRHEPIVARRIGIPSRGLRWTKRHPAGAALLLLVMLLLMLGTGLVVQDRMLAAERLRNSERARPKVDDVARMLGDDGEFAKAAATLEQIAGPLTPELQERVAALQWEVRLVQDLDAIRSLRIAIVDARFDLAGNHLRAEAAYDRVFREAGFAVGVEDVVAAGKRIRSMHVRRQVISALDDWAIWCESMPRIGWIWLVAHEADPDPSGWRERFRDMKSFTHPDRALRLADEVDVTTQPVGILLYLAEEMGAGRLDNVPFLRRVQQVYPGDFWVNWRLGDGLLQREPEEGIRYLQAALAVRPRAAIVHETLGRALAAAKRRTEARDCFLAAVRIEPRYASAHTALGRTYEELGEFDKARAAFATAVELDPADARSHYYFGSSLLERGDAQGAVTELQKAVHLEPDLAQYHQQLGHALTAANRTDEAKLAYETMHRLAERGVRALLAQNRLAEALAETTEAAQMEPKSASSLCDHGDCLARLGRRDDAVEQFRSALRIESRHEYARGRLIGLLASLDRHDEAIAVYEQAVTDQPDAPQAWDGWAELCLFAGRTDDYNRVRTRVVERFGDATDPRACELAARVAVLLPPDVSLLQRATTLITRALAAEPATGAAGPMHPFHFTNALVLYRAGRWDDAAKASGGRPMGELSPAPLFVVAMSQHHLGTTDPAWRLLGMAGLLFDWRSAKATGRRAWLMHVMRREAEALIAPQVPALLAGQRPAAEDEDRAILLAACCAVDKNAMATRLYGDLLSSRDKMGLIARQSPYLAACVAAAAGAGTGADSPTLDDAGRALCRKWAREWLEEVLKRKAADLSSLPAEPRQQVISELRYWTYDPDLASLREPSTLELPEEEQKACRQLWDRQAALMTPTMGGEPDNAAKPDAATATAPTTAPR